MRIVGIDLGTTNSVVAYVDDAGQAHAIADEDGRRIVPSVVWFPPDSQNVEVGELARRRRVLEPERVALLFKRGMGRPTFLSNGAPFTGNGKEWRPEELSSLVIRKLVGIAAEALSEPITDVVVTVPAYFGEAERAATREAGELAGLVVHLLPAEPMAAAVAHGLEQGPGESTILVFDLGGGTFDVTILKKHLTGQLEAVVHNGDRQLGGADFDRLIVDRIADASQRRLDVRLDADANDLAAAYVAAEEIKIELSRREGTEKTLVVGGQRLGFSMTRAEFEEAIKEHVENTELTVESALDMADLEASDIDTVLMVGGSCRIPAFQDMLRRYFGKDPRMSRNLDEDVARGAALMGVLKLGLAPPASALSQLPAPIDRSAHAIGMTALTPDNVKENFVVLPANTPIPTRDPAPERRFFTVSDNQTHVDLVVNEGDDSNLRFVDELGRAVGQFDAPRPMDYPFDVRMRLTADGILEVTAHDGETKRLIGTLRIERKGSMTGPARQRSQQAIDDVVVL